MWVGSGATRRASIIEDLRAARALLNGRHMTKSILLVAVLATAAHAQVPAEILNGLDTSNHGPSKAGVRDCDKAEADQQAHFDKNMNNPAAAVFGGAKLACSYLELIAWKPPAVKKAPSHAGGKGTPSAADVAQIAADWWAGSDDAGYVKVLSGGVAGSWQQTVLSDAPGVTYARKLDVFHVIVAALANDTQGCFVVYGELDQRNLNHPDPRLPVSWGASEYKATNWQRAQKIECPKGAKAPKPPKE